MYVLLSSVKIADKSFQICFITFLKCTLKVCFKTQYFQNNVNLHTNTNYEQEKKQMFNVYCVKTFSQVFLLKFYFELQNFGKFKGH